MPDAGNGGDLCLNTQPRPHQESRLLLFLFFFLFLGISAARVSAEFASLRRSPASRAGGEFLPSPGVVTAVRGWGGGGGGEGGEGGRWRNSDVRQEFQILWRRSRRASENKPEKVNSGGLFDIENIRLCQFKNKKK